MISTAFVAVKSRISRTLLFKKKKPQNICGLIQTKDDTREKGGIVSVTRQPSTDKNHARYGPMKQDNHH